MDNREKYIQDTVKRIRSIQTIEEFEKSKDEILDLMEKVLKAGIETLGSFIKSVFSMSPEEREDNAAKFRDENYLVSNEIAREIDNLVRIPGIDAYGESFGEELEKRLSPFVEEYTKKLGSHMDLFMGGMAENISESIQNEIVEEPKEEFVFDGENPDTPEMLYTLYASRTLADLEENKEQLFEFIGDELQDNLYYLELFTETDIPEYFEGDKEKIDKIRYKMSRLSPEIDKEFERIGSLPDSREGAEKIKKELQDHISEKITEINQKLEKLK